MKHNLCPLCRQAMRLWALDSRFAPTDGMAGVCVRAATVYRDFCHHSDAERYTGLMEKINFIKAQSDLAPAEIYRRCAPFFDAIEQLKNAHGGYHTRLEEVA